MKKVAHLIFITLLITTQMVTLAQTGCLRPNATVLVPFPSDISGVEATITWTNPNLNTTASNAFSYHRVIIEKVDPSNSYGKRYVEIGGAKSNNSTISNPVNKFGVWIAYLKESLQPNGTYTYTPWVVFVDDGISAGAHRYTIIRERILDKPSMSFYVDGIWRAYLPKNSSDGNESGFGIGDRAYVGGETCFGVEHMNATYYYNMSYKRYSTNSWNLWLNPSYLGYINPPYSIQQVPGPLYTFYPQP